MQRLLEVAHPVDRALEDRHLGAEPERDHRGVVADDAAADDDDLPRRDAGDAAEQQAAPALRPLEVVRARLRGEPAGDLAHRRQQRQPAILGLDRLVRDGRDPALDERARERLVGGDVQVGEEHEPFAEPWILGRDRLLHLEQELGALPDLVDGRDAGAVRLVLLVGELAAGACARLDDDLVPALDELARARGRQRDPVLLGLDLPGDADSHAAHLTSRRRCLSAGNVRSW